MIIKKQPLLFLFSFCCLILLLSACKSKKIGSQNIKSDKELQQALELHNNEFDWFSAKGSLKYKNIDGSGTAKINVRMKKDSVIWLNIKKFSVEISRVMMTPDSVFIVYRWERLYERGRLDQFTRAYNADYDFAELQDLFYGNVITTDKTELLSQDSTAYQLSGEKNGIQYDYHINPYNLLLEKFYASDNSHREVIGKFGDYKKIDDGDVFSYLREYTFKEGDDVTYLAIDYSDVEIGIPKKIKFSIPSHYDELR